MNEQVKKFLACPHHNVQSFTEYCLDCGENRYTSVEEIMKREGTKELNALKEQKTIPKNDTTINHTSSTIMNTPKNKKYIQAEGFWKVTTEGDCEGRTTQDLGLHFGFVDDIAFALADKCYYSLCFKAVEPFDLSVPKATKVNVVLDIDSGTWDMKNDQRQQFMENLLQGRDTAVEKGDFYASVNLVMGKSEIQRKEREKEMLKQQALAKLSNEERAILGF